MSGFTVKIPKAQISVNGGKDEKGFVNAGAA